MGTSTNGILVYGYDFGGDGELKLAETKESDANPYGYFKTSWWDDEADVDVDGDQDDDGESPDLFDRMTQRLYESIPDVPAADDSWDCAEVVKNRLGVWFESYCSGSYPMYLLVTHKRTVHRGDTKAVDPTELAAMPNREGWDDKLAHALSVLEVTPDQDRPRWLMASYWSN